MAPSSILAIFLGSAGGRGCHPGYTPHAWLGPGSTRARPGLRSPRVSRALTWLLRLLPALGLVLFLTGVGVFGPLQEDWWDAKGFVVNLASGVTAACFGVPIAFFILQRLLRQEDDKRSANDLTRQFATSIANILHEAEELAGGAEKITELEELAEIGEQVRGYVRLVLHVFASIQMPGSTARVPREDLARYAQALTELLWSCNDPPQPDAIESNLATIHIRWNFVSQELIPQARIKGVELAPDVAVSRVTTNVAKRGPYNSMRQLVFEFRSYSLLEQVENLATERPNAEAKTFQINSPSAEVVA